MGNPHLVHITDEIVSVKPAANPQLGFDWQFHDDVGRRVQFPVHVNARHLGGARRAGIHHLMPLRLAQSCIACGAGKIAIDRDARRAGNFDLNFIENSFDAPIDHVSIDLTGPEPGLGGMCRNTFWKTGDAVIAQLIIRMLCLGWGIPFYGLSAHDAFVAGEIPAFAYHAVTHGGADILRRDSSGRILNGFVHVQHGDIAVCEIKDRRAAGFADHRSVAPIHFNFLPGIASDGRDLHPYGGKSVDGIPLLDFVRQWGTIARTEAYILAIGLGFAEVEGVFVQSY